MSSVQAHPETSPKVHHLPPLSPLKWNTEFAFPDSPPGSPTGHNGKPGHPHDQATDVDRNINKFGDKHKMIRRMSSTEWESPKTREASDHMADITNDEDRFKANIDLNNFPGFEPDEIDIDVYGYDVLVHARKDNPNDPNHALSEFSRQYRLPDDIDLESVQLRKNLTQRRVSVEAEKLKNMGKPVSYRIFDSTNHHDPHIKLI